MHGFRLDYKEKLYLTVKISMVEVAGPDGNPAFVHQPWTITDIEEVYKQLLNLKDVGGQRFGEELERFCQDAQYRAFKYSPWECISSQNGYDTHLHL